MKLLVYFLVILFSLFTLQTSANTKVTKKVAKDSTSISVNINQVHVTPIDTTLSAAIKQYNSTYLETSKVELALVKDALYNQSNKDRVITKVCSYYGITEADLLILSNKYNKYTTLFEWLIALSLMAMVLTIIAMSYKQKWKINFTLIALLLTIIAWLAIFIGGTAIISTACHPYTEITTLLKTIYL